MTILLINMKKEYNAKRNCSAGGHYSENKGKVRKEI